MNTTKIQTILEQEKQLLEQELSGIAVPNQHASGGFTAKEDDFSNEPSSLDNVELGTEIESLARNEAITDELEARYQSVTRALGRIADGSYGTCTTCGDPIEPARLDANPAAATCIKDMG